ncbi:MAG: acetyl-CoA carboxylase biotin carboxyl carrier protein [Microcystaceae cyanobacterium]
MTINITEIRELLLAIAQTQITEVNLKTDSFDLTVKQGTVSVESVPKTQAHREADPVGIAPPPPVITETPVPLPQPTVSEEPQPPSPPPSSSKWVEITAPMVGTFYRAPSPDDAPYVNVNDVIQNGQIVCIVEAMKLMNEIEAEVSGKIMEIAVENGEPVEYGQTLMWVNPE